MSSDFSSARSVCARREVLLERQCGWSSGGSSGGKPARTGWICPVSTQGGNGWCCWANRQRGVRAPLSAKEIKFRRTTCQLANVGLLANCDERTIPFPDSIDVQKSKAWRLSWSVALRLSSQQQATRWRFSTKFSGATRASSESSTSSVEPVETERWRRRSSPPSWTASLELCQVFACLANLKQAVRPSPPKLDAFDVRAIKSTFSLSISISSLTTMVAICKRIFSLSLVDYIHTHPHPSTRSVPTLGWYSTWEDLHSDLRKPVFLTSAVCVTSFRPITFYVIFLSPFSSVWNKIIKFWQRQEKFQCITWPHVKNELNRTTGWYKKKSSKILLLVVIAL